MKQILIAAAACLSLTACETAPAGFTPMPFDFASRTPIRLNVAEVKIVEAYRSPMTAPNMNSSSTSLVAN